MTACCCGPHEMVDGLRSTGARNATLSLTHELERPAREWGVNPTPTPGERRWVWVESGERKTGGASMVAEMSLRLWSKDRLCLN